MQLDKQLHSKKAELLEAFSTEYETYVESQEYKDLQEKLSKSNDDDDYKQDNDPKGYQLYKDYLEGKFSIEPYVTKVVKRNWQDADLHAKAVDFYIRNGKLETMLNCFRQIYVGPKVSNQPARKARKEPQDSSRCFQDPEGLPATSCCW